MGKPQVAPPHKKDVWRESLVLFRAIKRQKDSRSRQRYAETAGRITEGWKPSDKPCDCQYQDDGPHNRISVKVGGGKWASICPIRYYLLLGWKAIVEQQAVPPEKLYWQLLGKPVPERKATEG